MWLLASLPLWLGDVLLESYLGFVYARIHVPFWLPLVPYAALMGALAARLQRRAFQRHRLPVAGWTRAAIVGQLAAALVFVSLAHQWSDFVGNFGAVKIPALWGWTYVSATVASTAICLAAAEVWVLRPLGLGRRWPLWITARAVVSLALLAAYAVFKRCPRPPYLVSEGYWTWWGGLLGAFVWHAAQALAVAWLLDVLVFSRSRPPEEGIR